MARVTEGPPWVLDRERIDAAGRALGLTLPVRAWVWASSKPYWGEYRGVGDGTAHGIRVRRDLAAHDASFTVWHELAHAVQCEQLALEAGKPITWAQYEHSRRWRREINSLGITDAQLESGEFDPNVYNAAPMESDANVMALRAHRTKLVIVPDAHGRYGIAATDLAAA